MGLWDLTVTGSLEYKVGPQGSVTEETNVIRSRINLCPSLGKLGGVV